MPDWADAVELVLLGWVLWTLRRRRAEVLPPVARPVRRRQACEMCGAPALPTRTHFGAWRCKRHQGEVA